MSNLTKLKIKIKHLALEPAIIKHEERKALKHAYYERDKHQIVGDFDPGTYYIYRDHRVLHVRPEARATQLVYAFLRDKKYADVEQTRPLADGVTRTIHNSWWYNDRARDIIKRMSRMLYTYGPDEIRWPKKPETIVRMKDEKMQSMDWNDRQAWIKDNVIPEYVKEWIEVES